MKILFLTDNFPPEVNAPATRTYEHCKEWVQKGADVTVITCFPNFPQGKLYEGYKNKLYQKEEMDGIKVIRVWTYITANKGTVKRTLDFISFMVSSAIAGLFVSTDYIIATSPQFFTALSGSFLSFIKRKKWLLEIRDIWPESVKVVTGMDNSLIRFFEFLEKKMYQSADKIVVVTPMQKDHLIRFHAKEVKDKIGVVTNGVDLDMFPSDLKRNDLKASLHLESKTIVGYIGTHGMAHGLAFILGCAKQIKDPAIHFLFIGDGAQKNDLLALKEALQLENITMLPSVSKKEVVAYLSIIDIGLVNLIKSDLFKSVIPSKIFELAAMRKPILMGVEGEVQKIIENYNAGLVFEPENEESFLEALKHIVAHQGQYKEGCTALANAYDRKKLAADMLEFLKK